MGSVREDQQDSIVENRDEDEDDVVKSRQINDASMKESSNEDVPDESLSEEMEDVLGNLKVEHRVKKHYF